MSQIKTRPVGERFEYCDVVLEVVESPNCFCNGCYWQDKRLACDFIGFVAGGGACDLSARSDGKNVIFQEVESSK